MYPISFAALITFVVIAANALVWYRRGIRQHPRREEGYRRLATGLVAGGAVPCLAWQLGALLDGAGPLQDRIPGVRAGSPFELLFALAWLAVMAAGTYWMYFRRGAEELAQHPGLFVLGPIDAVWFRLFWGLGVVGGVGALVLAIAGG